MSVTELAIGKFTQPQGIGTSFHPAKEKIGCFFHILPYIFFRFQSIGIIRVHLEIGSLHFSFGVFGKSFIAEISRSIKWSRDRILDDLFAGHCYLIPYTRFFGPQNFNRGFKFSVVVYFYPLNKFMYVKSFDQEIKLDKNGEVKNGRITGAERLTSATTLTEISNSFR